MKTVLTIAGSDCSGGAGIQADLKTCSASGVYCYTVITAVTAQNPAEVISVNYVGDKTLGEQLEAVLESARPDAVKIGMLPCESAVKIVAHAIRKHTLHNVIFDPVLSATSGASLTGDKDNIRDNTIKTMKSELFPLCTLVTPNLPEMCALTKGENPSGTDITTSGLLNQWKCGGILIKGGHNDDNLCKDILTTHIKETEFTAARVNTCHTHGTGCTLSSAIAANLAKGYCIEEAVRHAKDFTLGCIKKGAAAGLFSDNGPLIHF